MPNERFLCSVLRPFLPSAHALFLKLPSCFSPCPLLAQANSATRPIRHCPCGLTVAFEASSSPSLDRASLSHQPTAAVSAWLHYSFLLPPRSPPSCRVHFFNLWPASHEDIGSFSQLRLELLSAARHARVRPDASLTPICLAHRPRNHGSSFAGSPPEVFQHAESFLKMRAIRHSTALPTGHNVEIGPDRDHGLSHHQGRLNA